MQTVDEDDLGHSSLVYILPVDKQVRHHGYISVAIPYVLSFLCRTLD